MYYGEIKLYLIHHSQLGAPQKEKKFGGPGTCPVCPLVKTALAFPTYKACYYVGGA